MRSFLVAGLSCVLLTGCFTATPKANRWAREIEAEMPGTRLEREFGLKLGRISTSMARGVMSMVKPHVDEDSREAMAIARGIRRIEVATYQVHGATEVVVPVRLQTSMESKGWQTVVRVREDDSYTWVVFNEKKQELRGLMVVSLELDELTVVRLNGRLNRTLAAAIDLAGRTHPAVLDSPEIDRDSLVRVRLRDNEEAFEVVASLFDQSASTLGAF